MVITDGRECLFRTLKSARDYLPAFDRYVLINDCPDPGFGESVQMAWGEFEIVPPRRERRGFGGAIQAGWDVISEMDVDYVFHLEDDFVFNRDVDLDAMARLLTRSPSVAQVVLRRQAWGPREVEAGGVVEVWPDEYVDQDRWGLQWLQHDLYFSTNPSLYRRELLGLGWPTGSNSEARFTEELVAAGRHFAFWGRRTDEPWVTHIGEERTGVGY